MGQHLGLHLFAIMDIQFLVVVRTNFVAFKWIVAKLEYQERIIEKLTSRGLCRLLGVFGRGCLLLADMPHLREPPDFLLNVPSFWLIFPDLLRVVM